MENPEEILHSLEEFSKMKPKDIPRELEDYLCYVAKTGNPVYQWQTIKSLFREKLLNVITEFYESCPTVDIPPCPNVELFNYELMKNFILEKLDTFAAAPFTVQRICELLTAPRKEYNRIDKYMRALEKNILVVSTMEPGNGRRSTDNRDGIVNGIENDNHDINVEEMDESPSRARAARVLSLLLDNGETENQPKIEEEEQISVIQENLEQGNLDEEKNDLPTSSNIIECPEELIQQETIIACHVEEETEQPYISFDGEALVSCDAEPQEEIRHEVVETTEINSSSTEVKEDEKKLEEIEAEIRERVLSEEEKEVKSEATITLEEPNEALPSIPCPDLDEFPQEDPEQSEELTVSESGLPSIPLEPEESVQELSRSDPNEEKEKEIVEAICLEDAILKEKILDEAEKGEKPSEKEDVEEPLDEPKISSNDIPMEIDTTDEPQREKIANPESDEPTSTSVDVTL